MGFVRKLKTTHKWFAINEICRNHPHTKTIINGNADVIRQLSIMNGIMVQIASQHGVVELPGEANKTLQGNGFPVPKIVWMGELPFDTHDIEGGKYVKTHLKQWAAAASELRSTVHGIVESLRLAADVLNAAPGEAPNPGGQV